jgi:murein DD-endopeptidase MepM/ murein hydrolase activator NlpD
VDFSYYGKFNRPSIEGAGIQSVMKGRVAAVVADRFPYGNMLIIETPGSSLPPEIAAKIQIGSDPSLYVLYAHLERPAALRLGDSVEACQLLGTVGRSGNAGGPHLHLEMRLGPAGTRFKSMAYYLPWASQEEQENYTRWRTSGLFRHFDPMLILRRD